MVQGVAIVTRFAVLAMQPRRVVEAAATFTRLTVTGIAVFQVNVVVAGTLLTAGTELCQVAIETWYAPVAAWTCNRRSFISNAKPELNPGQEVSDSYLCGPSCICTLKQRIVGLGDRKWQRIVHCPECLDTSRADRAVWTQGFHSNPPHT